MDKKYVLYNNIADGYVNFSTVDGSSYTHFVFDNANRFTKDQLMKIHKKHYDRWNQQNWEVRELIITEKRVNIFN